MIRNIIAMSVASLFLLASASAQIVTAIPTVDELKDPYNPTYGLHLERVDIRQKALRKQGIANDISTKIVLFRVQKALLKELIEEKLALVEDINKKEGKTSPRKSTRDKIKAEIVALKQKKNDIDVKITTYREVQRKAGKLIMETFGLTSTQLANIPPKAKSAEN